MSTANQIGKRGESIFAAKISKGFHLSAEFLGDKFETIDFLVSLNNTPGLKAFCMISVKTTLAANPYHNNRLRIQVPRLKLDALKEYKIPTYLVGIDLKREMGYIVSTGSIHTHTVASVSMKHSITDSRVIRRLWREVNDFWNSATDIDSFTSSF